MPSRKLGWLVLVLAMLASTCGEPETSSGADQLTQRAGVLVVGHLGVTDPPFEESGSTGHPVGFDADLITEFARRLGLRVEWVKADVGTIFVRLAAGEFDVAITPTPIPPEPPQQITFTDPYYNAGTSQRHAIAVDPARIELREEINGSLSEMIIDGRYQAIYDTWFDDPTGSILYEASSGDDALTFSVQPPPTGAVGVFYFWDFCGPGAAPYTEGLSLLQCAPGAGATPSGGHPPYHFQLDTGSGFPPMGLHLQKDGVLNGTPATATTGTPFRICAVDLDANQACADVVVIIEELAPMDFSGTWQVDVLSPVCPSADGFWSATLTIAGDQLTGTWRDSYHGDADYVIDAIIENGAATWTADLGEESMTLTGTFDLEGATVEGVLIGPVCTQAAGRWIGTFRGTGTQVLPSTDTPISGSGLSLGDCFNSDPETPDQAATIPTVDCDQPHDNEIFFGYAMTGSTYPSDAQVGEAFDHCVAEFLDFVGIPYQFSQFEVSVIIPSTQSWEKDDRAALCVLYDMDLSKLTGSMRDANR